MLRFAPLATLVAVLLCACGPRTEGACRPAITDDTRAVRMVSTSSHALATYDLTIDLATRRMTGSAYDLEGSTVTPYDVDRVVTEEELAPLRTMMREFCLTVYDASGGTPSDIAGGTTVFSAIGRGDPIHFHMGAPTQPFTRFAEISRDTQIALAEAWPTPRAE